MDSKNPNRRGFLRGSAVAAGLAAGGGRLAKAQTQGMPAKKIDELIAYGDRSHFVTSVRVPVAERHSPDEFGLTFHVLTPLQDSYGIITPSSLHYTATHRGSYVPDINPDEHRLMIHGMRSSFPGRLAHHLLSANQSSCFQGRRGLLRRLPVEDKNQI